MSLSDKIQVGKVEVRQLGKNRFTNYDVGFCTQQDIQAAVKELKSLAFGWMSGGCDEEICEQKWNKIVGDKLT